jgi:type IV pilus assembly protein PilY1
MLNMKTSTGRAFKNIDDKFRVGFSTINNKTTTGSSFLKIKPFDSTQKSAWYTAFYATQPGPSTPLLGALSKAGRLYAGKLLAGNDDPVLYSCQQNFTLLTTDGYWSSPVTAYGPYKEDNVTEVGDQDGVAGTARPYLDALAKPNTLADVAQYYYKTDLRPVSGSLGGLTPDNTRVDVSTNNVPSAGSDSASWQHMTTFTLGLGVPGTLVYNENYLTGASSDYNAILQGTKNWPDPTCGTATCDKAKLDDLWHAAVNGRGQYLSASNPDSLVSALRKTLAAISRTNGSAATAATSNLEPVAGDNYAFVAQYSTAVWTGDLQARTLDLATGALSANSVWSAKTQMAGKTSAATDTRTIKMRASNNTLVDFSSANLSTQKTAGYFKASSSNPNGALSQYVDFSAAQKTAATDDAMIAYIRGQSGSEDNANNTDRLFRERAETVLGDIVNSAPVYVRKPPFTYADAGYTAFASAQANRQAMVYVGANDGMLHAFNATTGNEAWAFVPTAVMPYLYKLADYNYSNNHRFFVDGSLTVGDVFNSSSNSWRTILVGGLGGGGRAYFALDITDPAAPVLLWEFSSANDADLGYSYGNPIITKRASDGKWIVAFASGYNNTAGDSKGRLYVVDALAGTKLSEIITDNSVTNPDVSGIARINNFVSNTMTDNTTQYVYGGDLGGALWRFDLSAASSQKLGKTSATTGNQPITVRPEIGYVRDNAGTYHRVIYFATGRYLGFNDLSSSVPSATVAQAVYAVADTGTDLGVLTGASANLVAQTMTVATRSIDSPLPVDLASNHGWYVNLPVGQRVSVDLKLQVGTLVVVANIPQDDYCVVGGSSVLYEFAYKTGTAISTIPGKTVGFPIGSSIGTGLTLIKLPNNKVVAIVTQADTSVPVLSLATDAGSGLNLRRVSWRELN